MDQLNQNSKRFFKEAKAMAKLSHPNIVKIYDINNDQTTAFFTMELISGCNLEEYVSKNKPTIRKIISLMEKIILAVEYAHQNGIIHRDLKTSNILLDNNDEPYVMDFGLARESQSTRISQSGTAIGTPSYMPPEQAKGEIRKINKTSDTYSLGAILYEFKSLRGKLEVLKNNEK
jgi:serine/threonine protein kinase